MSKAKGVVGMSNIGNTCYGNATLQAIRHQVDLTIFFLQGQHTEIVKKKKRDEKTELLEAYSTLSRAMWTAESGRADTRPFWKSMVGAAMKAGFEQFAIPAPHDAHEFLGFLLDQFHEGLAEEVDITLRLGHDNVEVKNALNFWKNSFEKSYSPLVELVFGLQRKIVKCDDCYNQSITWATMNMIEVSIPKTGSTLGLIELMEADGIEDPIEEYHCEKCSNDKARRTKAAVSHTLWRLGNWVIIVLKRFDNSGRRINTQVTIPMRTSFKTLFHPDSNEPSVDSTYELFSTIHHFGNARGGHYTAHAKHPVTECWAYYDDEATMGVSEPRLDESVYIVMYRRVKA